MSNTLQRKHIESGNIEVFPFKQPRVTDHYCYVFTEPNVAKIAKTDTNYVVNYDSTSKDIEFVISGYYFKANLTNILADISDTSNSKYITATITYSDRSGLVGNDDGNDENSKFEGVTFCVSESIIEGYSQSEKLANSANGERTYISELLLLKGTYTSTDTAGSWAWDVPSASYARWNLSSMHQNWTDLDEIASN